MHCPPGCTAFKETARLTGSSIYRDDSSICLAAIHNGILSDEGGYLIIGSELGRSSYEGMENNNLVSAKWDATDTPWGRSFTVNKYVFFCP